MKLIDTKCIRQVFARTLSNMPGSVWGLPLGHISDNGISESTMDKVETIATGWWGWSFSVEGYAGQAVFLFGQFDDAALIKIQFGESCYVN
jgi:hypothetical protein